MIGDADNEDMDDDNLPECPLHIQKAQSHDYQPSVESDVVCIPSDHKNPRAASSKTSSTSVISVPGPSTSKRDECYK